MLDTFSIIFTCSLLVYVLVRAVREIKSISEE